MKRIARILVLFLAGFGALAPAAAREPAVYEPVLLAASPKLTGPYARTVVFAIPTGNGMHIGFILNRPTSVHVASVLPQVPAAKQVPSPVFLGGPHLTQTLIAFTRAPHAPAEDAVEVLPELFMAFGNDQAAQAAERFPARTRVFAGAVAWESGELQAELAAAAWEVLAPDLELVIGGSPDTLWQRALERTRAMVALR